MNSVKITNDKGRLSKQEIDQMVQDAEKYKEQDEKVKGKIQARNDFENYCYQLNISLLDESVTKKLSEEDKKSMKLIVDESLKWIEQHATSASEEDFKNK